MSEERIIGIIVLPGSNVSPEVKREVEAKVQEGLKRDGKDARSVSGYEMACRQAEAKNKIIH